MPTRRDFLTTATAAAATTLTTAALARPSDAQTIPDTAAAQHDHSASNPGQQNQTLVSINPSANMPPPTDHGTSGPFWHSFDLTHRRVQGGGWTHQVTERELPLSKEVAGVNMRLAKGGFREAHWHTADEWALMLTGRARVTLFSPDGSMFVDEVGPGDLWLFPAGSPHSIQGIGEEAEGGCEFLLVFNQGGFSEESTFLLSDWLKHTPPAILQQNLNLSGEAVARLPHEEPLYIFASTPPTQSLQADRAEIARVSPSPKKHFTFKASTMPPTITNTHGSVKIIDGRNFPASFKFATAIVTLKPGGLRELHWHPNGSEWQFWIKGQGRMTVFNAKEDARTTDFRANDVGYVPNMAGHYIQNTGTEDLVFLELFVASEYQQISLNNWLRSLPAQVALAHTNLTPDQLARIPPKAETIL